MVSGLDEGRNEFVLNTPKLEGTKIMVALKGRTKLL